MQACSKSENVRFAEKFFRNFSNCRKNFQKFSEKMAKLRLSDILECMICLDEIKQPKMLPCQHSFCLECLREVYREKGGPKFGKIICPICKRDAILQGPKSKAKKIIPPKVEELDRALPNNFALVNLIDYKKQQVRFKK